MQVTRYKPVDRRRHPRTRLAMTLGCIRLDPDGGDVVDSIQMTDISCGGLGAICERPYYPGQRIVLNLPMPNTGTRRNVYATVARCNRVDDEHYVGFEFDAPYIRSAFSHPIGAAVAAA